MTKKYNHEIEFKWTVKSPKEFAVFLRHAKKLGAQIGAPQKIAISDTYLDSASGIFAKSGIKTRVRSANRKWELTQKHMSVLQNGLAKRKEKTIPLPDFNSPVKAIHHVWTKFLRKSLRGEHINALFTIQNQRVVRKLKISDTTKTEACFDQVKISRGRKTVSMKEIELEFLGGKLSEFKRFTTALTRSSGLRPAKISKVATAIRLL